MEIVRAFVALDGWYQKGFQYTMKSPVEKEETSIELSLKLSELRYRRLYEAAQDGILILDAQTGMITDVMIFPRLSRQD